MGRDRIRCGFSRARGVIVALAAVVFAAYPGVSAGSPSAAGIRTAAAHAWSARMEALFQTHPGLKSVHVGVWNDYARLRWYSDELQSAADRSSPDTRWKAFLAARTRERSRGPSLEIPWYSLGPSNISGRIQTIAFDPTDPQVIYAGSAGGGPWKSYDGGASWVPIGDGLPTLAVGAIAVLPRDRSTVLMGTGDPTVPYDAVSGIGILRSTDGGISWDTTRLLSGPTSIRGGYSAIEVNPIAGVVLAAGRDGLLRSADDGATWSQVEASGNWTDVKWRPGAADTAYAVEEYGGVFMSSDGGRTFMHLASGLPPDSSIGGISKIGISPNNPDYVYVGFSSAVDFSLLGIYRSIDAGSTWSLRASTPNIYAYEGYYINTLAVDPQDHDRVFAGGFLIWVSGDGGVTWTNQWDFSQGSFPHPDNHAIAYRPGHARDLWVATDGGLYESPDGGSTWLDRNAGLVTVQFYSVCLFNSSKSIAYGGSQDNGTLRYSGTPAWSEGIGAGGDGGICNCDQQDPRHVYGEWAPGDHFVSWDSLQSVSAVINNGLTGDSRFIAPVDLDRTDGQRLFTATKIGIFRTTDGGGSWRQVESCWDVVSISISPVASNWIWALERSSGIVRRTTDGGETWVASQAAPFAGIGGTKILADPRDSMSAYCTFLSHPLLPPLVLRTHNGGATWEDATGNLLGQTVNTIAIDPDQPDNVYVGTGVGVWVSQNRGGTWYPYGTSLPHAVVLDLQILPRAGKLRAATFGRGLWEAALLANGRIVESESGPLLLERASSNPTRGTALFRYAGHGTAHLQLRIFNVGGRLVTQLADGVTDGIVRTVGWDTHRVRSGLYLAVLESGGSHVSKKVIVLH